MRAWAPTSLLAKAVDLAGFRYDPDQDIIYSKMDALQRRFGYAFGYDAAALTMSAVLHCEPIFFDYSGKTWMIELWKGQYGLETGCEIGVYTRPIGSSSLHYAVLDQAVGRRKPHDVNPKHNQFFDCASDDDRLMISFTLKRNGERLFSRGPERHWWLTGFRWGVCSEPQELTMDVLIVFRDVEMTRAFEGALRGMGYSDVSVSGNAVGFVFDAPRTPQPWAGDPRVAGVKAANRAIVQAYGAMRLPNNDPNQVPDRSFNAILNSIGIRGSDFVGQVVALLGKENDVEVVRVVDTLVNALKQEAAEVGGFLTRSGFTVSNWIESLRKALGVSLNFSCVVRIDNRAVPSLRLRLAHVVSGYWVVPPPTRIASGQSVQFWLADTKGSPHGAQGWVEYGYVDEQGQERTVRFAFDCPTGFASNSASISPGGAAFNFYAQSGSHSPDGWGGLHQVPSGGHPLFVAFFSGAGFNGRDGLP